MVTGLPSADNSSPMDSVKASFPYLPSLHGYWMLCVYGRVLLTNVFEEI